MNLWGMQAVAYWHHPMATGNFYLLLSEIVESNNLLIEKKKFFRMIAVRCEPQNGCQVNGIQVAIAHSPRKDFFPGQLVRERKWENLGGSFKEVRWDKMEGKNFLNKMELLMASLTSS